MKEAGASAALCACFLGLYTVSSVLGLPLLGFHTVAGYTYGTFQGALLVSVCQTVGAACSLIFARLYAPTSRARTSRATCGSSALTRCGNIVDLAGTIANHTHCFDHWQERRMLHKFGQEAAMRAMLRPLPATQPCRIVTTTAFLVAPSIT